MSYSGGKRKSTAKKMEELSVAGASNALIDNCHDYSARDDTPKFSVISEEDFPSLPVTPEKPPVKRGKTEMANTDIVSTLSTLINARSDELKTLVQNNTAQITGLRGEMETVCRQMSEVKGKVSQLELSLEEEKKHVNMLELRITEMERYSRRWNLKLHGVAERVEDKGVRKEVIRICQALLPSDAERLPDVIDTVHRVGVKKPNATRGIIIQFSSRVHRAAVWAAAKNSSYLKENGLRFAEDLCKADRESRMKFWPLVSEARKAGKIAYFVGGRAFIERQEISLPG